MTKRLISLRDLPEVHMSAKEIDDLFEFKLGEMARCKITGFEGMYYCCVLNYDWVTPHIEKIGVKERISSNNPGTAFEKSDTELDYTAWERADIPVPCGTTVTDLSTSEVGILVKYMMHHTGCLMATARFPIEAENSVGPYYRPYRETKYSLDQLAVLRED